MNAKLKKLGVVLTTTILLTLALANMDIAFSDSTNGNIDLFTQKGQYSGKGPDMQSDAFGLGEIVILYALVTDGEAPLQSLLVTFYVEIPDGSWFCRTAGTNASGIATVNFRIPQESANESEIFGEWFVLANVLIDGETFQDSLTFIVDWIVKLLSVRTIDENLTFRTNFGVGGDVGLEITLRNIAMITKSAAIAITIQDELGVPANSSGIYDFKVQPNERLVFMYCKLYLPKWTHVGEANVSVSALTAPANQSGVPYCPSISTEFYVLLYEPLTITFHDVSVVEVTPSAKSAEAGQPMNVSAIVQNEGTEIENFNVSAYYDGFIIETVEAIALTPYSSTILNFTFNTTSVNPGNYTITVSIPYLANEADFTDNIFTDGVIEIKPKPPIVRQYFLEVKTEPVNIVTIPGEGWYEEYANVSLAAPYIVSVSTGVRYKFSYWDVDGLSQGIDVDSINVFMDANRTATAHYILQYYLTVYSPYGTPSGAGWYDAESTAYVTLNTGLVDHGNSTRRVFTDWSGDASGTNHTRSDPILMNESKTAVANWKTQYYLTVRTDPPEITTVLGEGWYDESTNVTISAPAVSDYNFEYWDVNGASRPSGVISLTVHMNTPQTATAHYTQVTQIITYTLTITATEGGTTNPASGTYTYTAGSTVQVAALPNANYNFSHWELDNVNIGSANPVTVHMGSNHTLHAVFVLITYTLKIETTTGGTTSPPPGTYTHNAGSAVQVTATPNANYVLDHWELDTVNVGSTNPYSVSMTKDHTLKAVFSPVIARWFVPEWFYWFLLLLLALLIILLIILFYYRKRKKKAEEAFYSGWTAWYHCYDLRARIKQL